MANWSLPTITDLYTNFLAYLKSRDDDATRMHDTRVTAATNAPDYSKRWNDTTKTFQNWLSSAWSTCVLSVAGGGTGATTAADARTNLAVYSTAQVDAAIGASASHTTASGNQAADVTITLISTFFDGPSVSLSAGTWFVTGSVVFVKPTTTPTVSVYAKLWDGVTIHVTGYGALTTPLVSDPGVIPLTLSGVITLGATATVKISGAANVAGTVMQAQVWTAYCSYIRAVKIA